VVIDQVLTSSIGLSRRHRGYQLRAPCPSAASAFGLWRPEGAYGSDRVERPGGHTGGLLVQPVGQVDAPGIETPHSAERGCAVVE